MYAGRLEGFSIKKVVKDIGKGASTAGGAVKDAGQTAGGAVKDAGLAAGGAVKGAGQAVGRVGKNVGQAVKNVAVGLAKFVAKYASMLWKFLSKFGILALVVAVCCCCMSCLAPLIMPLMSASRMFGALRGPTSAPSITTPSDTPNFFEPVDVTIGSTPGSFGQTTGSIGQYA